MDGVVLVCDTLMIDGAVKGQRYVGVYNPNLEAQSGLLLRVSTKHVNLKAAVLDASKEEGLT